MAHWRRGFFTAASVFQCAAALSRWASVGVSNEQFPILPLSEECRLDSAVYRAVEDAAQGMDVTNAFNRLIALNGIYNLTGHRALTTVVGDPAPDIPKMLEISKNGQVTQFLETNFKVDLKGVPVYNIGSVFMQNEASCREPADPEPGRVDRAIYHGISQVDSSEDVTMLVNELVRDNGITNFTLGLSLNDIAGDPAPGEQKVLQVLRGRWVLAIVENLYYDLEPLYREPLPNGPLVLQNASTDTARLTGAMPYIDFADYRSTAHTDKVRNVTKELNTAIEVNGLFNISGGDPLWELLGDPAPGEEKMLRISKGHTIFDVPFSDQYNLVPLYLLPPME